MLPTGFPSDLTCSLHDYGSVIAEEMQIRRQETAWCICARSEMASHPVAFRSDIPLSFILKAIAL